MFQKLIDLARGKRGPSADDLAAELAKLRAELAGDTMQGRLAALEKLADYAHAHPEHRAEIQAFALAFLRERRPKGDVPLGEPERDVKAVTQVLAACASVDAPGPRPTFAGLDLGGMSLSGIDLRGCDLSNGRFAGCNFLGGRLDGANLTNADLESALLMSVHLDQARLDGANLKGANLTAGYVAGASLRGANLSHTICVKAFFAGVDLTGANLDHTQFEGADLTGAIGVTKEQFATADVDELTHLPEALKS